MVCFPAPELLHVGTHLLRAIPTRLDASAAACVAANEPRAARRGAAARTAPSAPDFLDRVAGALALLGAGLGIRLGRRAAGDRKTNEKGGNQAPGEHGGIPLQGGGMRSHALAHRTFRCTYLQFCTNRIVTAERAGASYSYSKERHTHGFTSYECSGNVNVNAPEPRAALSSFRSDCRAPPYRCRRSVTPSAPGGHRSGRGTRRSRS